MEKLVKLIEGAFKLGTLRKNTYKKIHSPTNILALWSTLYEYYFMATQTHAHTHTHTYTQLKFDPWDAFKRPSYANTVAI